ncbi:sce7726 family protein [Bacillus sp. ISL-45]|uniref:sce7726 family protein n=1 Tax=Bacillus sp. ISL-45 TaxID=2819128 RepID=UPI001BE74F87|nr:sce7726 family protein [Bacillus sp. ISL-45]MBT2661904.1 sce7726 family protein [Bacillus sp. ISL-45]
MLTDFDIRAKLIEKIHKENQGKHYRVIEELGICDGLARADIAVANGVLLGYEIKSDHDSLERLPNQVICYDKTFDKNTIIVGEKFADKIHEFVPDYWGIEVAYINRFNHVSLKRIRASRRNQHIVATNLLDLLWTPEIKSFLKQNKVRGYSNKDKAGLKELATSFIPIKDLKEFTRETLKTRTGWREDLL